MLLESLIFKNSFNSKATNVSLTRPSVTQQQRRGNLWWSGANVCSNWSSGTPALQSFTRIPFCHLTYLPNVFPKKCTGESKENLNHLYQRIWWRRFWYSLLSTLQHTTRAAVPTAAHGAVATSFLAFNLQAPCVLYIKTGVSLLSRERFLYI